MNKTSIKILNRPIKRKRILTIYIFIQMPLHLLAFKALSKYEINIVEYSSVFLALIYSFIAYLVLLFNNKNKQMIYYYSVSTIILSFFLVVDLGYLKFIDISYGYAQIIILFIILDITLKVLTQNINKRLFFKYIVIGLWTLSVVCGILNRDIYILVYQITFLIISIYPLLFSIFNYKKIKDYGSHLIPVLLLIIILNTIFLVVPFFITEKDRGMHNYDFYIYLNIIEIFLSYLVLSALGLDKLLKGKKNKMNMAIIINTIFIIGYLYFIKYNKENLEIIIFSLLSFFIILKETQLLNHYAGLENQEINDKHNKLLFTNLFKDILQTSISDYKREELYKEQVADFLHDEILQDVIYIKKELQDNYKLSPNDKILKMADRVINKTRGQISLYKPYINYEVNLAENYYNLIQSLRKRFGNDSILIDFICDSKLFLSPPYDLVIYRMIHELVTNIFKHSKGDFSVIELKTERKTIILTVTNYGDYLCNDNVNNTDSRGLKIIKREVDRFGGTLDIGSSINSETLEDIFDNSVVNIRIEIPIRGDITYEHFINR